MGGDSGGQLDGNWGSKPTAATSAGGQLGWGHAQHDDAHFRGPKVGRSEWPRDHRAGMGGGLAAEADTTSTAIPTYALKAEALASMSASFERLCLAAGLETLSEMLEQDATAACGERHERGERRQAHRWGRTKGKIGFHGGKAEIARPRVRGLDGAERVLPSWENAVSEDLLGKWAMNQMLINVSTRRFKRSVRLPEGDVPASDGAGLSKSANSRRFVALSAARMKAWMETRLDDLDLLAIQIDGSCKARPTAAFRRGAQWLRARVTSRRGLSKNHQRLPKRMGGRLLRRPAIRHRNRATTLHPRHRRHTPHPRR